MIKSLIEMFDDNRRLRYDEMIRFIVFELSCCLLISCMWLVVY